MLTEELTTTMMAIRQKLVFIGNYSVGKTSIIKRILDDSFKDNYESTIGIDYYTKNIGYKEIFLYMKINENLYWVEFDEYHSKASILEAKIFKKML